MFKVAGPSLVNWGRLLVQQLHAFPGGLALASMTHPHGGWMKRPFDTVSTAARVDLPPPSQLSGWVWRRGETCLFPQNAMPLWLLTGYWRFGDSVRHRYSLSFYLSLRACVCSQQAGQSASPSCSPMHTPGRSNRPAFSLFPERHSHDPQSHL